MSELAAITNVDFGKEIDLTHSQVSRLRSGDRLPSLDTMVKIDTVLKWPINEQVASRMASTYCDDLEEHLRVVYGETPHVRTAAS